MLYRSCFVTWLGNKVNSPDVELIHWQIAKYLVRAVSSSSIKVSRRFWDVSTKISCP